MRITPHRALHLLLEPNGTGAMHMRRDAALLAAHTDADPVRLRLYTWRPPAISLGHMQRAAQALDLAACAANGVDVVQRPTGGRAVLHWEEITYAVVASVRDERFGHRIADAHAVIAECLAVGLDTLGIEIDFGRPAQGPVRDSTTAPCFASSGRYEVLVRGRKLVGSAQRRNANAFLQHGSVLIGRAHEHLVDYLRLPNAAARSEAATQLRRATVTLEEILGRRPDFAALAEALVSGFRRRLQAPLSRTGRSVRHTARR